MNLMDWYRSVARWSCAVVIGAMAVVGASTAPAQMGGFGGANFRSPLSSGEVDRMIETLALDESQALLVKSLYEGFSESYEAASEEARNRMRETFRQMRETGEWQGAASVGLNAGREWQKQSAGLVQSFFSDVQTVLTKEQQERWDRYQREWRRRSSFRGGSQPGALAGENIDLFELVDGIDLTDEEYDRLDPVLDAYSIEIDPALAARDHAFEDMTSLTSAVLEGKSPIEDLESKFKALQRSRALVRDVNDRYVQHLAAHLSPEKGEAIEREFRRRSFRDIYSPTLADRYIETVRERAALNQTQADALQMIERDFLMQSDAINRQLADLQKKREIEDQQRFFDRMTMMAQGQIGRGLGRGPGGPGGFFGTPEQDDPRRALMQQKDLLVENTLNSVVTLLTPEQLAAAPKPERRQARGGDRGGREMTDEQRRELEMRFRERRERGFDRGDGGNRR